MTQKKLIALQTDAWFPETDSPMGRVIYLRQKLSALKEPVTGADRWSRLVYLMGIAEQTRSNAFLLVKEEEKRLGKERLSKKEYRALLKQMPDFCVLCQDPLKKVIASHVIAGTFLRESSFKMGFSPETGASIANSKSTVWTEPIFCRECDGETVGRLENLFKTEVMEKLNQSQVPEDMTLEWSIPENHIDAKSIFALGASLGLRVFYTRLYAQLRAVLCNGDKVDLPRIFQELDELRKWVIDPSAIKKGANTHIFYHIRPHTRMFVGKAGGGVKELPGISQYLESFHHWVHPVHKVSDGKPDTGFLAYIHFGKYTFMCSLALDPVDIGEHFEGFQKVEPESAHTVKTTLELPFLVDRAARENKVLSRDDLEVHQKRDMKSHIMASANSATVYSGLPAEMIYEKADFSVKIPEGHQVVNCVDLDQGIGLSYILCCKDRSGKKYAITHLLNREKDETWKITVMHFNHKMRARPIPGLEMLVADPIVRALNDYLR